MTHTIAILGCGDAKQDLSDKVHPIPLAELYTSTYFELKRQYGRQVTDDYYILSAKYGLADPEQNIERAYDLTVHDFGATERLNWARDVHNSLENILASKGTTEITCTWLAGQAYLDPIRPVLDETPCEHQFPFDQTAGIGEQMGLLKSAVESTTALPKSSQSQTTLTEW